MYNSVLCAMAKNENQYINEWVEHHRSIGFDHIFIYDNNDSAMEYIGNFIENKDKVTIINMQDTHFNGMQEKTYVEFYNTNSSSFNWIIFLDIDEFLTGIDDVNTFLNSDKFDNFDQIRIKWKLFGDDDMINRDRTIPVMQAFAHPITTTLKSKESKAFIRGHKKLASHYIHYVCDGNEPWTQCLPSGVPCKSKFWCIMDNYSNETVFVNHYMTKTLAEFLEQKTTRGDVAFGDRKIDEGYFFAINKRTPEKEEFVRQWLVSRLE